MLLHHYLDRTAQRLPDKVALIDGERRLSYRQLDRLSHQLAQLLRQRGVRRGDRVALFLDNSIEVAVGVYAASRVGAVFMPINALTKQAKLALLLNHAEAGALITHADLRQVWQPAIDACTGLHSCVLVGAGDGTGSTGGAGLAEGDSRTGSGRCIDWPAPAGAADTTTEGTSGDETTIDQDLAALIYTSGSTGEPKGVMLSHRNMVAAIESVTAYLGMTAEDRILCALPLAFGYGLYQVLMSVKLGATVVLENSFAFPQRTLALMEAEEVTVLPGVPSLFAVLINLAGTERLSRLRIITNAAAALSTTQIERLRALLPRAQLFSMYGLTECKRVTYLPPAELDIRPGSVGRGMPNVEVWLVDEAGRRLPNGSTGELVVRGGNVMRGYWRNPEETAARLKPGPLPGEVVLYSGDLFRTDADGWLYFVARKDDIIKSGGEKVSPRDVENVIAALAGVQEVAVIGVADERLGQAVKAFVVPREGAQLTEREVIRFCLGRLENFMAPKTVEFVAALPKTDTGKIRKLDLR